MKIPQPFRDPGVIFVLHLSKQAQEMAPFIHLFIHLYICSLTIYEEPAKCQALQLTNQSSLASPGRAEIQILGHTRL